MIRGTTGIQALDFIGRKIQRDKGIAVTALLDEIDTVLSCAKRDTSLNAMTGALVVALSSCRAMVTWR